MPWGSAWGGLWGGGSGGNAFFITHARAVSSRAVRVTFSRAPTLNSPIGADDAANLRNWTITRVDTGTRLELLTTRAVDGDPFSVEIITNARFLSALLTYEIVVVNVQSTADEPLGTPSEASFLGMPAVVEQQQVAPPLLDLYNPQTSGVRFNGGLVVGTNGDYTLETGISLIKKLVYRRLLTMVGEYYHLADQDYGFGLQPKELIRPADLPQLQTRAQVQVLQEPEIAAADVQLTLKNSGQLIVGLKLRIKRSGQPVAFSFPLQL